jgi:hypothetical protein
MLASERDESILTARGAGGKKLRKAESRKQ